MFGNGIYVCGICVLVYFMGLCSVSSAQTSIPEEDCLARNGTVVNGKCLLFQGKFVTRKWQDAKTHCETLNAHLASIPNAETQKWFEERMAAEGVTQIWTGGNEALDIYWEWVADGRRASAVGCYNALTSSGNEVLNKSITIPDLAPEKCIVECRNAGYPYAGVQSGTICRCGYTHGEGAMVTGCATECAGDQLQSCGGWQKNFVYLTEGAWSTWKQNQPNNHANYQHCVALDSTGQYKFADETCESEKVYVCDIPQNECVTGVTGEGSTVRGNFSCYFISAVPKKWYQAQEDCVRRGGHLVTLHGEADWTELKQLIETFASGHVFYWIGLNRRHLTWANGEFIKYTNWVDSSPDNYARECIMVDKNSGYKWDDKSCTSGRYAFFCEIAISPPTTTASTSTTSITTTESTTTMTTPTTTASTITMTTPTTTSSTTKTTPTITSTTTMTKPITTATEPTSTMTSATKATTRSSTKAITSTEKTTTASTSGMTQIPSSTNSVTVSTIPTTAGLTSGVSKVPTIVVTVKTTTTTDIMSTTKTGEITQPTTAAATTDPTDTTASNNPAPSTPTKPSTPSKPSTPTSGTSRSPQTPSTPGAATGTGDENSTLFIAMIIVLCIFIAVLVIAVIIFVCLRRKKKENKVSPEVYTIAEDPETYTKSKEYNNHVHIQEVIIRENLNQTKSRPSNRVHIANGHTPRESSKVRVCPDCGMECKKLRSHLIGYHKYIPGSEEMRQMLSMAATVSSSNTTLNTVDGTMGTTLDTTVNYHTSPVNAQLNHTSTTIEEASKTDDREVKKRKKKDVCPECNKRTGRIEDHLSRVHEYSLDKASETAFQIKSKRKSLKYMSINN